MNWVVAVVGLVVGLGGLAVAGIGLVLSYKDRAAGLRGALYTKQVESYGLVLEACAALNGVAIDLLSPRAATEIVEGAPLDTATRAKLRTAAEEQVAAVSRAITENMAFLPESVVNAVGMYRRTFAALTAPKADVYPPGLDPAQPGMELSRAFVKVWQAMRHQLGTDPLSEQTHRLVGASSLALDERD
jgi:hypothetical protein